MSRSTQQSNEFCALTRIAESVGFSSKMLVQSTYRCPDGSKQYCKDFCHSVLIRAIIEQFRARFAPGSFFHLKDARTEFASFEVDTLRPLGRIQTARMPEVVVYHAEHNRLILIDTVTNRGLIDSERHVELFELFSRSTAQLILVTAFTCRDAMKFFLPRLSWNTEVWIADEPNHLIHFNGESLHGPIGKPR